MNTRTVLFTLFVLCCVGGAAGYIQWRVRATPAPASGTRLVDPAGPDVAARRSGAHIVSLSSRADAFGRISVASLDAPDAPVITASVECERSHFAGDLGLCLTLNRETMTPRGYGLILDRRFQELGRFPLAGLPIRARVSRDQRYAAATVFVTGESYAGDFTTRTSIIDLGSKQVIADLEQFTVERDGAPFKKIDFNFWGVTFFNDSNQFFATLGTEGQRLLVLGDIAARRMRVVTDDVECPSLAPDERHLVFKRTRGGGTGWQLWAMDVSTRERWPITEDGRDVDDQVEWLDNDHVVYGMVAGPGLPELSLGLWLSDIRQGAGPNQRIYARAATSPSVIRQP